MIDEGECTDYTASYAWRV